MAASSSPPIAASSGPLPTGPIGGPIPDARIGSSSNVPSAQVVNSVATTAQERLTQVAGENAPIRLIYGRQALGAQLVDVVAYNGNLVVLLCWGQGPINAVESLWLDQKQLGVDASLAGVVAAHYTGTQVAADPTLIAAYAAQTPPIAYSDVLAGIAYSVVVLPPNLSTGFPTFSAILQGLKVYDPRDATQTLGTLSTYKYSDNPALAIADLQTNVTYGARGAVDWASVTTTANACDALVAGVEKRRTLGLVMDTVQDLDAWFEALRTYAGCFLARNQGKLYLIPDRPAASTFALSETANPSTCRVKRVRRRSKRDVPTVSAVRYTDTSSYPWRDNIAYAYAAGAQSGTVPWKVHEVALPGITRYSQALREAIEQLNKLALTDLEADVTGQDEAIAITVGDVGALTARVGLAARPVRVIGAMTPELARPEFVMQGYDPAVYSDSVATGPTIADTNLPNPAALVPPTLLVINETVYFEKVTTSTLAGSQNYLSRFDISWTAPSLGFPVSYRVELYDGTTKIRDELVSGTTYSTPAVQQGKTYTVNVYSRNTVRESQTPLTGAQLAQGKFLPPGPVPSITRSYETGGEVNLAWDAAPDIDVVRYEWRYTPNQTVGGSWATATLIDRPDTQTARFKGLPVGTHRFYVRAIDSVGNYSTSDCTVDITITTDANAFVQDHTFTSPTLTNMVAITGPEGATSPTWATAFAGDTWNATMPSPLNTGANPVFSYHAAGTSRFRGDPWDLGSLVAADFQLNANTTNVTGVATYAIETSPDGVTYTAQPGISFRGPARFVRPLIETTGTMIVNPTGKLPPKITLSALAKPETGLITTNASGVTLVQLTGKYSAAQDLQVSALGSAAKYATFDRVLLHPETGLMVVWNLNAAGNGFLYKKINFTRVLLADDYLEFDVYIDPSSAAALNFSDGGAVVFNSTGTTPYIGNDQNGYNMNQPAVGMDALARGIWYSRKIAIGAVAGAAGSTTGYVEMGGHGDQPGDHKVLFRNVRITNGAGTDRQVIWTSGEPVGGTGSKSGNVVNDQYGPSNSFTVYAFNSSGAQVANDVRYSFKGF